MKSVKGLLKEVHYYVQALVNTSGCQTWLFELSVRRFRCMNIGSMESVVEAREWLKQLSLICQRQ